MSKKVLVVINPSAGNGSALRKSEDFLRSAKNSRIDTEIIKISGLGQMLGAVEKAIKTCEYQAIVAVGGDGLVHALLPALQSSQLPFAVIPAGTGNDFARANKFFKTSAGKLINAIKANSYKSIDLMEVVSPEGSTLAVQILSLGFDALVNERANSFHLIRGRAKYIFAMVRELSVFKPKIFSLTIDGRKIDRTAMLIAIANGANYGGGMQIVPHADHGDGVLDLLILNKVSTLELIRVFPKVYKGSHITHPAIEVLRGRKISIESKAKGYADGEFIGELPLDIKVLPRALKVVVV